MKWMLYLAILLAGMFLGFFVRELPNIDIHSPFRISEAAQLMVTLTLAFIIPFYIDRRLTNRRAEKDVVIEQIKRISSSLNETRKRVNDCYYQAECSRKTFQQILMGLRNLSNGLTNLKNSLSICKMKRAKESYERIWETYLSYKKIVSGGGIGSSGFKFTETMFEDHEKTFSAFEDGLNRLILVTNRH